MSADTQGETVTVTVHFFARARELAGTSSQSLHLPRETSPKAILEDHILKQFPDVAILSAHCILALNHEYLSVGSAGISLNDGDELAVIPPISGG